MCKKNGKKKKKGLELKRRGSRLSCEERRQDRHVECKKYIWGSGVSTTSQVQPPKVVFWLVTRDPDVSDVLCPTRLQVG